jgi:hypothetical protein
MKRTVVLGLLLRTNGHDFKRHEKCFSMLNKNVKKTQYLVRIKKK